jgi:hypothetical protein
MSVFVDVENQEVQDTEEVAGTMEANASSMAIGNGSAVFRADQSGIWLGAEQFANAPFKVDMSGNLTATSADLGGTGYSKVVTFAQDAIPTSTAIGDLWVDTNDDNKMYRAASVGADQIAAGEWVVVDQDAYKLDKVGGTYVTTETAAAAKVKIFPDANTGIIAYASDGTSVVFKVEVGGTNVGDVTFGNYAGSNGVLWDQSAGKLIIKGDMTAGNISGVTITGSTISTGSTGIRVSMAANDAVINFYDSGGNVAGTIDDTGTRMVFEAKSSRDIEFTASGGDVYCNDKLHVDTIDENGAGYVDVNDDLNVGGWLATDSWASLGGDLDMNGNDINEIGSLSYASETYTGKDKLEDIISSVQVAEEGEDKDKDWVKMDHAPVHKAIKKTWTKHQVVTKGDGKKELIDKEITGYSLNRLVMVQNKMIMELLERVKTLEKGIS